MKKLAFLFSVLLSLQTSANEDESYTINLTDIPAVEYVRFASKICEKNFIFEETDLNFKVTVVSKEKVTPKNVMTSLIQILRIHGLSILEQNGNLIIHKNIAVKELAKIEKEGSPSSAPIVTRVFRIKNADLQTLFNILKPMISEQAILEISPSTKQLIATDVSSNMEKISELIEIIDSPESSLEIEVYKVKKNPPDYLIDLTNKIIAPLTEGSPYILVAQNQSGAIFIVSTPRLIEKSISILSSLDSAEKTDIKKPLSSENIFVYRMKNISEDQMEESLRDISKSLEEGNYSERNLTEIIKGSKRILGTNAFLFTGSTDSISKLKEILNTIDIPSKKMAFASKISFFVYEPKNRTLKDLYSSIKELSENLSNIANKALLDTLKTSKVLEAAQAILFTGNSDSFEQIKELLVSIDLPTPQPLALGKKSFFIYKIENVPESEILSALKNTAENLKKAQIPEKNLIDAIESVQYIPETNSLLFTGKTLALQRIQKLIPSFDVDLSKDKILPSKNQFLVYKPTNHRLSGLAKALKEIAKNLSESNLVNPSFMRAIDSLKTVEATNSILFTGDPASLKRIEELLSKLDSPASLLPSAQQNILIWQPKYASKEDVEQYLKKIASHLDVSDKSNIALKNIITRSEFLKEANSFMFTGGETILNKLKSLLEELDSEEKIAKTKNTYQLYKLKNIEGNLIEEDLDNFASKLRSQGIKNPDLLHTIEHAKWIEETNSIMLTGTSKAIEEAIVLIQEYDVPRKGEVSTHDNFLLYKPKFVPTSFIEKSLKEIAENLEKAKLADPNLLSAIKSVKTVEATNSLAFTGTSDAIAKIKDMIASVDIEAPDIARAGQITYLLYKIKKASPQHLISAIKSITQDLSKTGTSDIAFIQALSSVTYKPETNSLLFTGTPEALQKVKTVVEKFDVESLLAEGPAGYYIYKPKYLSGPSLKNILQDFVTHLKMTGVKNIALFSAIENMKWDIKTKSLIISADQPTLEEIKELLITFDVPAELKDKRDIIQPMEELCFMVYKLQYHKGDEIQTALRQIAKELSNNKTKFKEDLLQAINSIQWIQITNSLLCSGERATMDKLRELIKSLDVPLKQVFIEVLVIQTSLTNLLNFGLDWGAKYQRNKRFAAGISNTAESVGSNNTFSDNTFMKNLNDLSQTERISGSTIPFSTGFDLGVIGDILMHRGKSFLSLGSFIEAVQEDAESSVITTPKLITQDGKTSTIFFGFNIPYIGSTTSYTQTTQALTSNLEYRDVGTSLSLTPVLGNSDTVTLDINLSRTVEVPSGTSSESSDTASGIKTSKATMQTTVHIPNKKFLVLSGMISDEKGKAKTGIPCLGGLPYVGAAFSKNTRKVDKKNIVIFMRPHIINTYQDMTSVTTAQEETFRENSGTPLLEEEFDEGLELLKTIAE